MDSKQLRQQVELNILQGILIACYFRRRKSAGTLGVRTFFVASRAIKTRIFTNFTYFNNACLFVKIYYHPCITPGFMLINITIKINWLRIIA